MAAFSDVTTDQVDSGRVHDFWARHPLLLLALASAGGIAVDVALDVPFSMRLVAWILTSGIAVLAFANHRERIRRAGLVLGVTVLGGLSHAHRDHRYETAPLLEIAPKFAEPAILDGRIDRPIVIRRHPLGDLPQRKDQSEWQSILELDLTHCRRGQSFQPCQGRLLVVSNGRLEQLRPGDVVRVHGQLQKINGPTNPGEIDFRDVYRHRGIHARMDVDSKEQIVVIGESFDFDRPIATLAARSRELLLRHCGGSAGPLAVALVIGQREFVDSDTRDLLLVTGTAHLLSVSGLHLAIVIVLASWTATLLRFPLSLRIAWILFICGLYTAITGGRPPVMRAAVLVGMVMLSLWFRRPAQPINTLALAALILMFLNPKNLFHVGVQLSFLAVGTLFLCGRRSIASNRGAEAALENEQELDRLIRSSQPAYYRYGHWVASKLSKAVWYSGCVSAISMPLVWHQFHVVSFVGVVTNIVLSPFLFWCLAMGVATVVGGWILDPLAVLPGFLCAAGLSVMRGIIDVAAAIPAGHWWLPSPPVWWVVLFYVVMVGSLSLRHPKASWFRYAWIPLWGLIAWGLATTPSPLPDDSLEATFVDVGHGTCVVLRDSSDRVWLYDCGRLANSNGSSRDIDTTLWSMGVTGLDAIFLSHADTDHYNALPGILRRFQVDLIVSPPGILAEREIGLVAIRQAIQAHAVPIQEVAAGDRVTGFRSGVSVLHPPRFEIGGSDNAKSMVLQINHGGEVLILPGDLERPGTDVLIKQRRPPPGGVLMAPHHGSLTMDAKSILQWSRPAEVIVSGGKRARRPEVREMLGVLGSTVHVTADVGAIRVQLDERGTIRVNSWQDGGW
ncbi:ComEC/Rec2 family competence protein [Novipirellula artificiosorum]|uniref:ComEC family competence protein n=1 Tax=Novipirellula artificiosorum TaxID=2528016 RepID=A0A5C6D292_9BACT|nr:ComEC/Rec2 family competence protein [Novipirellula artificiosorum]TWU30950.1 ComEC family competence protein [Novipirellula artificiosorum]